MTILAFDTCFGALSVAVRKMTARGEVILREDYEERATGHAERLMPMIEAVMAGAGADFGGIKRIAVTLGPGSFTGLRVAIATARALALATGAEVVGMTSLANMATRADLLAGKARGDRPLLVAVDARRDCLYCQSFGENAGDVLSPARRLTVAEAVAAFSGQRMFAVGSGAAMLAEHSEAGGLDAALPLLQPHARMLALLAPALTPLDRVVPLYLRDADAKPQLGRSLPRADA